MLINFFTVLFSVALVLSLFAIAVRVRAMKEESESIKMLEALGGNPTADYLLRPSLIALISIIWILAVIFQ